MFTQNVKDNQSTNLSTMQYNQKISTPFYLQGMGIFNTLYDPNIAKQLSNRPDMKQSLFPHLPLRGIYANPSMYASSFSTLIKKFTADLRNEFFADSNNPNKLHFSTDLHRSFIVGIYKHQYEKAQVNQAQSYGKFNSLFQIFDLIKNADKHYDTAHKTYKQQTSALNMTRMLLDQSPVLPTRFTSVNYLEALRTAIFVSTVNQKHLASATKSQYLATQILSARNTLYGRVSFNFTVAMVASTYISRYIPLDQNLLSIMSLANGAFIGVGVLNYIADLNNKLKSKQPVTYDYLQSHAKKHIRFLTLHRALPLTGILATLLAANLLNYSSAKSDEDVRYPTDIF